MFHGLLKLPTDTPELDVTVDKAGDYLLSEKDYYRADDLYRAAAALFPASTAILVGLGYGLGKLKRMDESLAVHRRALALDPNNYHLPERPRMGPDRERPNGRSGSSSRRGHEARPARR